ncbi:FAD-dependent oxidoreductase [Cobetia sp. D5]|uniref:NAD(P)/FAD-dependent oxidoreductase n=1 Tax=unclassified Cobetia TaxID=2609414 RepID=UPI002D76C838|nr:FAD-dependent oxidoreductase [Cobetia sp. D5]
MQSTKQQHRADIMGSVNRTHAAVTAGDDITIVGAGIIGVACALSLARKGKKVTVIDRQLPGYGASWGNAGHMATEQVFPIADASLLKKIPGMLTDPMGPLRLDWRHLPRATPWFTRLLFNLRASPYAQSVTALRVLNESSLRAWRALLSSIGAQDLLKDHGSFLIHEHASTRRDLMAVHARMAAQGVTVDLWEGAAIRQQLPALSSRIQGGLCFPETGHVVNPFTVTEALVRAARHTGVEFQTQEIVGGKLTSSGVALRTHDAQTLEASRVLIACGAHSAALTKALTGVNVPLDTERGYHLMLPREADRLPSAVTSLERRFIMTPMQDGLRLAGTVEFAGLKRPPNMQRAWQLHKLTEGLFETPLDTTNATPWMGFRPSLPDSLPIIDQVHNGRVLLAFGHHHLGLTQAAITAEMVAHLASTRQPSLASALPEMTPYRLTRF